MYSFVGEVKWLLLFSEGEPFCRSDICRMILAGEVGLIVARESLLLARKMV